MTRWLAGLAVLAALAAGLTQIGLRTDAGSALGGDGPAAALLERPEGRQVTLALIGPDRDARAEAARGIAAALAADPRIAAARTGITPDRPLLDWLWRHRFRLAPPAPEDLAPAALAARLAEARAALTGAQGAVLGDRLLRDPTGSFARLVARLAAAGPGLPSHRGVWQSRDDRAALVFLELAPAPFDVAAMQALADRIRDMAAARGLDARLTGPRIVTAEVSRHVQRASATAVAIALALLLGWLVWTLRSARGVAAVFLPLAIGVASAVLAVAALFGAVHVIALGFGGALTGLAMDYPLHLAQHPGGAAARARRLVRLGAVTTAVAFLALTGSEIEALAQTGVFVATGLTVSALAAGLLAPPAAPRAPQLPLPPRLRLPGRAGLELALIGLGLAVLVQPGAGRERLFELPPETAATLAAFRDMLPLPSARYHIAVAGPDAETVLARGAALLPVLEAARASGDLGGDSALARHLPALGAQAAALAALPEPDALAAAAGAALSAAGMAEGFAGAIAAAYAEALQAPPVTPADLAALPALAPLAAGLETGPGGARERIRLSGPVAPERLRAAIAQAGIAGTRLVDGAAGIAAMLERIRGAVLTWFAVGAAAAFGVLALGLGRWRPALRLARGTGAALGLAAALLWLVSGPPGIFQIVALTLVVGIGIDYGLFLGLARDVAEDSAARRSTGLCASTTLIAFAVMALSPVALLSEIGLAVSIGVGAMLLMHATIPPCRDARPAP
ncbi:MMPL family transporter [Paralimibaculum aggregatum]|uniref:MMPL family transporter n=1 Tax=Paralimibaculum aggregatum TaxID=3036245 RepID=A0ABQ6LSF1_9RHOB|nr:MMPL family transporter [Limibaculum sp. NKW23]GMG85002.1 MMPL family transporter [Limibaculum sp. NKW23]